MSRLKVLAAGLIYLIICSVYGAVPTFDSIYPSGGQIGSSNTVTVTGTLDPWPVQLWSDSPGITAVAETNKCKISLVIATNVVPGPYLIRLYNAEGASAPRMIMVGTLPEVSETEPNATLQEATVVTNLPVTMNARFERGGDSDTFAVKLTAGRTFTARVDGYGLAAPMDVIFHLVDTNGTRVAFSHDHWNMDPFLQFTPKVDGTYYLRAMAFGHPAQSSVNFAGGANYIYRIRLSQDATVVRQLPLGLTGNNEHEFTGWNGASGKHTFTSIRTNISPSFAIGVAPHTLEPLRLVKHAGPELAETEPNNTKTNAQAIAIPTGISALISDDSDRDVFKFAAQKDQKFQITLWTGNLGFPMNAVFTVQDAVEKTSKQSNIQDELRDPQMNWTAPQDGPFFLTVRDLRDKGGTNFYYHLSIEETPPGFEFTTEEHAFTATAGKTNELKVKVDRKHGYKQPVKVEIEGLPEGVQLAANEIAADKSEATLNLLAPAEAKPFSGAIRLKATSVPAEGQAPIVRYATYSLRFKDEEQGGFVWIDTTDQLWLTLLPPAKP